MATASTRVVWKGAISFGLVHIPIALYTATAETRPKFNLMDRSTMSPVGNRQVNKATGEEVQREEVVKGIEVEEGHFVVLTKDEIRSALPKSTQTVDIERFVDASAIPPTFFQKPYYVAPLNRGQKAYALLLQTLKKTGKAGLARVVISTKQHLAALVPDGDHLVLNLLRWAEEVREAPASADVAESDLTERELKMAEQLVNDMADAWSPGLFHDEFKEKLSELVQQKAKAGEMAQVTPLPGEDLPASAEIIDLTELLRRSIKRHAPDAQAQRNTGAANDEQPARRSAAASRKKASPKATAKVPAKPRKSA